MIVFVVAFVLLLLLIIRIIWIFLFIRIILFLFSIPIIRRICVEFCPSGAIISVGNLYRHIVDLVTVHGLIRAAIFVDIKDVLARREEQQCRQGC